MKRLAIVFFSFIFLTTSLLCESAKKKGIKIVGIWDAGGSYDVIGEGNYLYVGSGGQVRIYDISTKEKIE
ncbi:MAG TPA: hypothetical protein ENF61_02090, partial [Firmicutes bacterium]|nr:hypothetical protein [Bacillota bacterium]